MYDFTQDPLFWRSLIWLPTSWLDSGILDDQIWGWVKREKDLWQLDAEVKVMQLAEMIGSLMQIEISLEKIKDSYEHPNKLAGS
jgi:hypothetical protein